AACAPAGPSAPTAAPATSAPLAQAKPTTAPSAPTPASGGPTPASAAPTAAVVQKPTAGTSVSRTVTLPGRFPIEGIKRDLPASTDGLIDAAFMNYPASPPRTGQASPGRSGEVNVAT